MKTKQRKRATRNATYAKRSQRLLQMADEMWRLADDFDTAVRDDVSTGLAYIVHSAYDCEAQNLKNPSTESWMAYIDNATAEWFRHRGFAEWYCLAAASLFHTSRPRILAEVMVKVRKGTAA